MRTMGSPVKKRIIFLLSAAKTLFRVALMWPMFDPFVNHVV